MGHKSLFVLGAVFCLCFSGCGKDTSSAGQSSPDSPTNNPNQQRNADSGTQALVVYGATDSPKLNEFQAVNVNAGKPTFDFTFTAPQDETLTMGLSTVKSTLLGCDDSDIGLEFSLYRVGADGKIDLSDYAGLGPSPTAVKSGQQYIARVTLTLDKSCLGVDYHFGIEAAPVSTQ